MPVQSVDISFLVSQQSKCHVTQLRMLHSTQSEVG